MEYEVTKVNLFCDAIDQQDHSIHLDFGTADNEARQGQKGITAKIDLGCLLCVFPHAAWPYEKNIRIASLSSNMVNLTSSHYINFSLLFTAISIVLSSSSLIL